MTRQREPLGGKQALPGGEIVFKDGLGRSASALALIGRHMTACEPGHAWVSPAGPAIGLSSSGPWVSLIVAGKLA
jgi:hypothetical protein